DRPQVSRGALGGSSRIVQLVSQPGSKRSQRDQATSFAHRYLHGLKTLNVAIKQMLRQGQPLVHQTAKIIRGKLEETTRAQRPSGGTVPTAWAGCSKGTEAARPRGRPSPKTVSPAGTAISVPNPAR